MGKGARIACIFTPMILTIASLITQAFIEAGGWSKSSDTLEGLYFMRADFSNLTTSNVNDLETNADLTASLALAQTNGQIEKVYQIYLWNYCSGDTQDSSSINYCSPRKSNWYFDPVAVWGLNGTDAEDSSSSSSDSSNPISSAIDSAKDQADALEDKVLGKSGAAALKAYESVAKWMFIAYAVSFWLTLATIVVGILAIFSRIGSFLTWICSIASSLFSFAASLTATVLFATLTGALKAILDPYSVEVSLGTHALAVTWLATAFSLGGTLFWLFSVCCCSGRSNPHHKNNKGGLWEAEPKGQGYGDYNNRGRGLKVAGLPSAGGAGRGYQRVSSPYMHGAGNDDAQYGDSVPLTGYPQHQQTGYMQPTKPGMFDAGGRTTAAYEPFRTG